MKRKKNSAGEPHTPKFFDMLFSKIASIFNAFLILYPNFIEIFEKICKILKKRIFVTSPRHKHGVPAPRYFKPSVYSFSYLKWKSYSNLPLLRSHLTRESIKVPTKYAKMLKNRTFRSWNFHKIRKENRKTIENRCHFWKEHGRKRGGATLARARRFCNSFVSFFKNVDLAQKIVKIIAKSVQNRHFLLIYYCDFDHLKWPCFA